MWRSLFFLLRDFYSFYYEKEDINSMKNTERFGLMLVLGGMLLYVQASKKMFELCDDRIDYLKATVDT